MMVSSYICDKCGAAIKDTCGERFVITISTPCIDWAEERDGWNFDLCLNCMWEKVKDLNHPSVAAAVENEPNGASMANWMIDPHRQ